MIASGRHQGPPVADNRPITAPIANKPNAHQTREGGRRKTTTTATPLSPAAIGSAVVGASMNRIPSNDRAGQPDHLSKRVDMVAITTINQASEASCAHSDAGIMGP